MFTLVKNADLYSPLSMGINDLLLCEDKIVYIDKKIDLSGVPYKTVDAEGKFVTPGFIDQHVHIIGGGGQQGFASLVPDVTMSELVKCGTTTVVGMLGTDGFVKGLNELYSKAKALDEDGLTAYMLTSYYGLPSKTMMDDVADDLIFIDKVIGCKLAISDDRSSFPAELDILRLINKVRLGGFTSGKGGVLHIHIGALQDGISSLLNIAKSYPSLISYISPTHLIRTESLFNQALEFASLGGMIDFSTGGTRFNAPHKCVVEALNAGVPIEQITFSSDGHGGVRSIDPVTGCIKYRPAPLNLNLREVISLIKDEGLSIDMAISLITSNPARNMKLKNKGLIKVGADADLCFLNNEFELTDVFAKGKQVMEDSKIIKRGRYEV